jgi:hypothetical protein
MSTPYRTLLCTTGLAIALLSSPLALACVNDAECDNGDTCSVPDTCNAGTCVLGGGGDANDDLVCDAEFDPGFEFNMTRLVIRRPELAAQRQQRGEGRRRPARPRLGGRRVHRRAGHLAPRKGALADVNPPSDDGVDHTTTWTPAECVTKGNGTVSCRKTDSPTFIKIRPNPLAPTQYKFTFKSKAIGDLTGPFFGPVRVVLSRGNQRRGDAIFDCQLKLSGPPLQGVLTMRRLLPLALLVVLASAAWTPAHATALPLRQHHVAAARREQGRVRHPGGVAARRQPELRRVREPGDRAR